MSESGTTPPGIDDAATVNMPVLARSQAPRPMGWRTRLARRLRPLLVVAGLVLAFALGMALSGPADEQAGSGQAAAAAGEHAGHDHGGKQQWTCSMHPQIKLPEPGKCPICGMTLIPLVEDEKEHPDTPRHVVMSDRAKALARIETRAAEPADTAIELRLLGRLAYDETHVRTITSWTDGRIDRLFVSAIGEHIKRGQTLAALYSPEVYAAQVDLIQAKLQLDRLGSALPIAKDAAGAALRSAKMRLRLLGVKPLDTKKITEESAPSRHVGVTAKYAGTVVEQLVHEGAYVKAGTPIFKTADLSTIWAQLDAYESDLGRIEVGQRVTLEVSSFAGERFEGKVAFVDPVVDPRTRTARVRVVVPNPDGKLNPGMFANAVIDAPEHEQEAGAKRLIIPVSAPLFTGKRSVVYVEVPDAERPTYEARVVSLGPRASDVYPVLSGLKEGERVVVRGAFSLDADLQIRGGESVMTMDDDVARQAREPVRVDDRFMAGLRRVMEATLDLHDALAADDVEGSKKAFAELGRQAAGFDPLSPKEARAVYRKLGVKIAAEARQAAKTDDIELMRRRYAELSRSLIVVAVRFGNPTVAPVRLVFCPMAFDQKGAHWLQRSEEIQNPFFGAKMPACGEIRGTAEPGARLSKHVLHALEPKKKGGAAAGHHHH